MDVGEQNTVAAFVNDPGESSHTVRFYQDEGALADMVAEFVSAGMCFGDRVIVIAAAAHTQEFAKRLDPLDASHALSTGQLVFLDASELLAKVMVGDMPDAELFRGVMGRVLSPGAEAASSSRIRAYGEMVDILWRAGNSRAALRLEELWNDVGKTHAFVLLCAYIMGNFYREGGSGRFTELCRSHTHVLSREGSVQKPDDAEPGELGVLQRRTRSLENEIRERKRLEHALRDALRDRTRIEDQLRISIQRERESRAEAEARDAFKEVFLGMLGHDLRNPLNTIMTTAELMTIRGDLARDGQRHLERIVSSGKRMQRMIEQILDVTRARLAQGIVVQLGPPRDLLALVSKIVDEVRVANPERWIELSAERPCPVHVDVDRFEQVVSNLLGNAVAHGDPARPIAVRVSACDGVTRLSVHNYGPPIEEAFLPLLFNPFKRGRQTRGQGDGLGLGLYISERIVSAHGGTIHVESSNEAGTRFEVILASA